MTSEHYLREIAELLKEMNLRLARIEAYFGSFPDLKFDPTKGWKFDLGHDEIPR
jgi:hypothetical protein